MELWEYLACCKSWYILLNWIVIKELFLQWRWSFLIKKYLATISYLVLLDISTSWTVIRLGPISLSKDTDWSKLLYPVLNSIHLIENWVNILLNISTPWAVIVIFRWWSWYHILEQHVETGYNFSVEVKKLYVPTVGHSYPCLV